MPESLSFFDVLLFNLNNQHSPCIPLIESLQFDGGPMIAIFNREPFYTISSKCGTKHIDRDINAAKNIRDEGLRIISCGTRDQAYCPDVRPSKGGRKKSTITRQFVG